MESLQHACNQFPDQNFGPQLEQLENQITEMAGHINAINYRFIKLLADFDEARGWQVDGAKSFAHWLNWKCGIGAMAAREKVRVARALPALPMIDAAFHSGEISYSKVRAMTRVATPDNEELLLTIARYGTAEHVEQTVRKYRRCRRLNEVDEHEQRPRLTAYPDENGIVDIHLRLPAEDAALVIAAVEHMSKRVRDDRQAEAAVPDSALEGNVLGEAVPGEAVSGEVASEENVSAGTRLEEAFAAVDGTVTNVSAGTSDAETADVEASMPLVEVPPRFSEDRATALLRIAEHYLASSDDDAGTLDGPGRCELVLHVNANEAHRDHQIEDGPSCYLDRNRFLSPQTARRLACDAMVSTVVEDDDGAILNIGRRSRTISKALRTALNIRDGGCRFPNCHQQVWTDAHHIHHWADGGETSLGNLITLCRHHHCLLHKGDFILKQEGNDVTFYNRQMNPINRKLYPQFDAANPERVLGQGTLDHAALAVDSKTAVTRWGGEQIDYGLVMDGLLSRDATRVP